MGGDVPTGARAAGRARPAGRDEPDGRPGAVAGGRAGGTTGGRAAGARGKPAEDGRGRGRKKRGKRSYAYAENQSDLARKLSLSRQTLWKYERMEGFPARGRRGYPVEKVLAFILGKRRESETGVGEDDELQQLRKKQIIVSTKLDEIRLHRAEGKSLPREVFEDEVSFLTDFFVGSYDTFVDRVAAETKDSKLVAIVEKAVAEAKSDLADQLESMALRFEEEARAADKAAGAPADLAVGAEKRQPAA